MYILRLEYLVNLGKLIPLQWGSNSLVRACT